MWFRDEECAIIVADRWKELDNSSSDNLVKTLNWLGKDLSKWNKTKFGKVEESITKIRCEIDIIRNLEPSRGTVSVTSPAPN